MSRFKSSRGKTWDNVTEHTKTRFGYRSSTKTGLRRLAYGLSAILILVAGAITISRTFAATAIPSEPSYGVMIQVSTLDPTISPAQLKSYLEDIRLKHRNPQKPAYINRIVLQDIADKDGKLYKSYLDVIAPYLPGGSLKAFDYAYVGTVDLAWTGAGSKYIEGIKDTNFRAQNVSISKSAAAAFKLAYPKAQFDWYITYEANLAGFWDKSIESAYLTYINTLSTELNKISFKQRVMWSPAFWTPYSQYQPGNELAWALPDLSANLTDLFTNAKTPIFLDLQDFVGQSNGASTKENAVAWIKFIQLNGGAKTAGMLLNAEQFKMVNGAISVGDSVEVPTRMAYYKAQGVPVGPSWEIRYWHKRLYGN